jgi:cytochrome c oxidase subunit 3
MIETVGNHEFQYSDARHQSHTAISGMWLFLASETLFFGALFLAWIYARHWRLEGFDLGARHTDMTLGTVNSVILITSSVIYAAGVLYAEAGNMRRLVQCCYAAMAFGVVFLLLKFGLEWHTDFSHHLFPGADFPIKGAARGGAQLFFVFYFMSTALHGLHMLIGLGLVLWIVVRAKRGEFTREYTTPVTVVGLYWAFVDMVWIVLYPLIYLIGRGA